MTPYGLGTASDHGCSFDGEDGTHRSPLQEDDGLTFAALHGARYRTTFELTRSGARMTLREKVDGDGYPSLPARGFTLPFMERRRTPSG